MGMEIQFCMPGSAACGSGALPDCSGLPAFEICQFTPTAPVAVVDQPSQIWPPPGGVDTSSVLPTAASEGSFHGSPEITIDSAVAAWTASVAANKKIAVRTKVLQRRTTWTLVRAMRT